MEDLSKNKMIALAKCIEENKGIDVVALDISEQCSWTNGFIIATTSSAAQRGGILKALKETIKENGWDALNPAKNNKEDNWIFLDCGDVVVNLMSSEAREYYELEERWFESETLFKQA